MFGLGKRSRTIMIDELGNILDETCDVTEHSRREITETLEALSQARIEVAEAMEQVRAESAKNVSNPSRVWAAALVGISNNLSEAYSNLRGAQGIEEAAYAVAAAREGYQEWAQLRAETGADASDFQGAV